MHPIRIPTDQDLQMYPHVFFTSPDIWDPSVLDHEITPSLLEDINQHSDDSLLQESIFDEYGDLHHWADQTFTFSIFLSGNLSITKWMKMNLTTDFHLNLMKKEDTGLALLTTRVTTLHGRSSLMIPTLSSSDLLSEVPLKHPPTSDWTHQKGRIHKI